MDCILWILMDIQSTHLTQPSLRAMICPTEEPAPLVSATTKGINVVLLHWLWAKVLCCIMLCDVIQIVIDHLITSKVSYPVLPSVGHELAK